MRRGCLALLVVFSVVPALGYAENVRREILIDRKVNLSVPANYRLLFMLWDAQEEGVVLWSEEKQVYLDSPTLRHSLGSVKPLDPAHFSGQVWLQICRWLPKEQAWLPLGRRTRFRMAPYALWSETGSGGPQGPPGPPGEQGPAGPPGASFQPWGTVPRGNTISRVDAAGDTGLDTSITIGADGLPVISYYSSDGSAGSLKVAKCLDPACAQAATSTVDQGGYVGAGSSIAVKPDGFPVVSYYDIISGELKVASCNDAACAGGDETVSVADGPDGEPAVRYFSSMAIGTDGFPVIAWYDLDRLKVVKCDDAACAGGNETVTTVDSSGNDGRYLSLAAGTDGNPIVAYAEVKTAEGDPWSIWQSGLKVARCTNPSCSEATITGVDMPPSDMAVYGAGLYNSITIGADGLPLISYLNLYDLQLRTAHCNDAGCGAATLSTVDDVSYVDYCTFTSVTIGADGLPLIAYHGSGQTLKAAHCNNAACTSATTVVVDDSGWAGYFSSVTVGPDGLPVISYAENVAKDYAVPDYDLKAAKAGNPYFLPYWRRR